MNLDGLIEREPVDAQPAVALAEIGGAVQVPMFDADLVAPLDEPQYIAWRSPPIERVLHRGVYRHGRDKGRWVLLHQLNGQLAKAGEILARRRLVDERQVCDESICAHGAKP